MKTKLFGCVVLVILLSSCDKVKVINSTDSEAVPVKIVNNGTGQTPTPIPPPASPQTIVVQKKIVAYMVLSGSDLGQIDSYIRQGWQPFGGISIYASDRAQALVKYE